MNIIQKLITKLLRDTANNIEEGSCEVNEEDYEAALQLLAHKPLSKEDACTFLNISRSAFDARIKAGSLPKGRKRRGWKELIWYLDDLILLKDNEVFK